MNTESLPEKLILASSSKYRKELLDRLGIPFDCQSPQIDESPLPGEAPHGLVSRLALQKAEAISRRNPLAVVIGSDQLAIFNGDIIGKPLDHEAAFDQLTAFSGQSVEFLTAVSVLSHDRHFVKQHTDSTRVRFRDLDSDEIERYLNKEQPYDCAGAFKAEALGIVLFESISSEDPTALVGLPLIRTADMLRLAGLKLP
jgi:septum formation protein